MKLFDKFKQSNENWSLICLEQIDKVDQSYFCYPLNAIPIGFEGCIMYCFIKGYDEMVFAVNPETCADTNVYPLAKNFEDFMSLVVTCKTANPVEQIVWMSREKFEEHLANEEKTYSDEQRDIIERLKTEWLLETIEDPYHYVKNVQKDFDGSWIEYSDEYYDVLGIERE